MSKFENLAKEIGKLVDDKNKNYGNAFVESEKVLKVLYPNGIKSEQYLDLLAITRILDKIFRMANNPDAYGENPTRDLVGYGLLWTLARESKDDNVCYTRSNGYNLKEDIKIHKAEVLGLDCLGTKNNFLVIDSESDSNTRFDKLYYPISLIEDHETSISLENIRNKKGKYEAVLYYIDNDYLIYDNVINITLTRISDYKDTK